MSDEKLILVADDNEPTRELIAGVLKNGGYDVLQAIDGGSAIKVLHEHKVDLAIIDQYMEPLGGFDVAQNAAAYDIDIPLLMITAHDNSDLLVEARKAGFDQIIHKPIRPDQLLHIVGRFLKK